MRRDLPQEVEFVDPRALHSELCCCLLPGPSIEAPTGIRVTFSSRQVLSLSLIMLLLIVGKRLRDRDL